MYGYALQSPMMVIDPRGEEGRGPGGPYHPPDGVRFKCLDTDSCPMLLGKAAIITRMIASHVGWDYMFESKRHVVDIRNLKGALARCAKKIAVKCKCTKKPSLPPGWWLPRGVVPFLYIDPNWMLHGPGSEYYQTAECCDSSSSG